MLVPNGVNLAQNTSIPLLGASVAPVTLAFVPVTSANLLMVLAMPISATAAFVVLRKMARSGPGRRTRGLMYGFSPYMVGEGLGHLSLVFVPFLPLPPFIAVTLVSILRHRGSSVRLGIYLGLLSAAQFLISPEILATVAILSCFAVVCAGVKDPSHLSDMARTLLIPIGVALVVGSALVAYPVWMMEWARSISSGRHTDPVIPTTTTCSVSLSRDPQRVALGMRTTGIRLIGMSNSSESGGYIGVPILLIAAAFALRSHIAVYRVQMTIRCPRRRRPVVAWPVPGDRRALDCYPPSRPYLDEAPRSQQHPPSPYIL